MNEFLHIGFDSYVNVSKVILIADMDSAKLRREMTKRDLDKNSPKYWNAGGAKELKSVILCDDGLLISSALGADTLVKRFNEMRKGGQS